MGKSNLWIFNPDYRLKNDLDRICLYSKNNPEHDSNHDWVSYIHPYQAVILSMFATGNLLSDVADMIASHFKLDYNVASQLLEGFVNNPAPFYTEWGNDKILFPKNVLVPFDEHSSMSDNRTFPDISELKLDSINLKNDRAHNAPHSILWMLTNKCVTNCAYCYADKLTKHTPLSTEAALKIIEEAKNLRINNIDVIGGEVFLKLDWDILVSKMVAYGMSPSYISTKVPITDRIIGKLKDTGYGNVIQISLDSLNPAILKSVVGAGKDYCSALISGIRRLDKAGFRIQIDTILTNETATIQNLRDLAQFLSTVQNLDYWEIRVPEYSLYTSARFKKVQAPRNQLDIISRYIREELPKEFPGRIIYSAEALNETFRNTGPDEECFKGGQCGYLSKQMFILPDGKVSACEQLYWHPDFIIGDLTQQTIEEVWRSTKALDLFNRSTDKFRSESACKTCSHFDKCNENSRRCVVKVMKAYGIDNRDYPDPRCVFAPPVESPLRY